MSKSRRLELIDEFKETHDKYLETLCLFESPENRKPIIEESVKKFNELLSKAERGELDEKQLEALIEAIKESDASLRYPKGACGRDCLMAFLRAQNIVVWSAIKARLEKEVVFALTDASLSIVADTISSLLNLAASDLKPWEAREKAHEILSSTTDTLVGMADGITNSRVLSVKPPKEEDKNKGFVN
jgi:vacuolar-type H+-ATPase subunit H